MEFFLEWPDKLSEARAQPGDANGLNGFLPSVLIIRRHWKNLFEKHLRLEVHAVRRKFSAAIAAQNSAAHDRAAFINTILDARSFNWTLMFMDLEHLLPDGVRVISIEPKQVPGHVEVKLSVGVTSDEAELKFERALEESKEFTEVQVQGVHQASPSGNQSGDQKVVQLTTVYSRI